MLANGFHGGEGESSEHDKVSYMIVSKYKAMDVYF